MADRGDLVTIETTDRNLGGVTDMRDREWPRAAKDDGRIAVPKVDGERLVRSSNGLLARSRPTFGGFYNADIWGPDGKLRRAPEEGGAS